MSQFGGCGETDEPRQHGGCGCGGVLQQGGCGGVLQQGGRWKNPQPKKLPLKARAWIDEVKTIYETETKPGGGRYTYREALIVASARRKGITPDLTPHPKKVKTGGYGKKNKRPLTFEAAQRILLQYYQDRAKQFSKSPLTGLKQDISRCHTNPKKILTPCEVDSVTGKMIVTKECQDSWKYRPGKYGHSPTGPGVYDMKGLDDLCGQDKTGSVLYNKKSMRKSSKRTK